MYFSYSGFLCLLVACLAVVSARSNIPTKATATTDLNSNAVAPITAVVDAAATQTIFWSTTRTSVSYPMWIGATVVTMVTTQTLATLIPNTPAPTSAPGPGDGNGGEVVETVIGRTTYEYRMGFSDGHSSTSWLSETHTYTTTV